MILTATFLQAVISGVLIWGGNLGNKLGPAHEAHWLCATKNICGPDETYVLQGMKPVYIPAATVPITPTIPTTPQTPGPMEEPKI